MRLVGIFFIAALLVSCQKERRIEWHLWMGHNAETVIEYTGPEGVRINNKPYDNYQVSYYDKPGEPMYFRMGITKNDATKPVRLTTRIDGDLIEEFIYTGDSAYYYEFSQRIPRK